VVKQLLWLNALFMPIWSLSWTLPCAFKGARRTLYHVGVDAGMWGCRVVAGYTLGIVLGMGVIGVWLGMVLDWAVRGVLFYFRMVSGRWLWKYPRVKASPEKTESLAG
jgi:Na+-driven multidrug efflux pump